MATIINQTEQVGWILKQEQAIVFFRVEQQMMLVH